MKHRQALLASTLLVAAAFGCGEPYLARRLKRQSANDSSNPAPPTRWAYDASYDWGELDPSYELCQVGTQQAPIPLDTIQGLSQNHIPRFEYNTSVNGSYYNWGYGPAFEFAPNEGCLVGSTAINCTGFENDPKFTFEENGVNETVYMVQWHIHAPADHSINGLRNKAELHFVHVDEEGHERAVLAFLIDPSTSAHSDFLAQLPFSASNDSPAFPNFNNTATRIDSSTMDPYLALAETGYFNEFWTYRGSLTSPPCTEGIRFFVSRQILYASTQQMQDILRISRFSAREEQRVWLHEINV